ncbi:uncharacterized protein LOC107030050 [Solanum pennellii]|uniref:Uncharacterized protein LOC107030050 n=1 Tax=Solanum pennellii TaxID=28526 RepID=A0ABM1HKV4_SOLPN|nr:uncharacterized protein LOC107030050 [Solanum pennellii]
MAPFEALYGRRSPIEWFAVGEVALISRILVHEAIEKICFYLRDVENSPKSHKSYVNFRLLDLEFEVYDWVYLKISPMKGVMRFVKKGKLNPYFVGPYDILKSVGKVAYELNFPNELASVHPVFYVSMLKKYVGDPTSIVSLEGIEIKENLYYEEVLVEILYRKVKKLRDKEVSSVKVQWRNHLVEGATREAKSDRMSQYPHLFLSTPTLA